MKNEIREKHGGKEVGKRSPGRRLALALDLALALVLLSMPVILTGCDLFGTSSNSPNVAPTTDYPVHEADTIPSTDSGTDSSAARQGVTPTTNDDTSAAVNTDVASETTTAVDNATLAEQVIAGDWGNGQDRIDALTAAGYNADDIQSQVNDMLGADTATGNEGTFVYTEPTQTNNQKQTQTGVTWHDEITEPIYEDQPVYHWNYSYTITKYMNENIDKTISSTSGYTYEDQDTALADARIEAQAALTKEIPSATLAKSDYNATSAQKQTGTKRVQTGTRIIQKAGWY